MGIVWLFVTSLFFYGWWNPRYLGLMLASIGFNYCIGVTLNREGQEGRKLFKNRKAVLIFGIVTNLLLLGYFKYANFFVDTLNSFGSDFNLHRIVLPLAISFFTFNQIAYIVDSYRRETKGYSFLHYGLFVTYFPHLIAGPVVHHKELIPQFLDKQVFKCNLNNLSVGLTIFIIGLFKKLILADGIALYGTPVFDAVAHGYHPSFIEAWSGSMAYTFQLYFDFSGYSDMAVGISRLFGIYLPLNFFSPYKSENIIQFWRRWHITLSRFLREYLYIPLGGNRKGALLRYQNLMITMVLGGLWHGAAWTFVIWGALHGFYLAINNLWHGIRKRLNLDQIKSNIFTKGVSRVITFMAVVVAWVFFRAKTFDGAVSILKGMAGMNGVIFPETYRGYLNKFFGVGEVLTHYGLQFKELADFAGIKEVFYLSFLLFIVWCLPNTQQFISNHHQYMDMYKVETGTGFPQIVWQGNRAWAVLIGVLAVLSMLSLYRISEFLYFQF